jgi:hypothetical protein
METGKIPANARNVAAKVYFSSEGQQRRLKNNPGSQYRNTK